MSRGISKKKSQASGKKQSTHRDVDLFFKQSRRTFQRAYKETGHTSVLVAGVYLEELVENGLLPLNEAYRVINDDKRLDAYLRDAELAAVKSESRRTDSMLQKIQKNTNTKTAFMIGVGAGLFASAAIWCVQPYFDNLVGRSSSQNDRVTPAPSHQFHFHYHEAPRSDKQEPKLDEAAPLQKRAPVLVLSH